MEKLWITAALFAVGLWFWSEFYRAIPNLEQAGVLKNFRVESIEPHQGEYQVIDKDYYGSDRRTIHPAAPVVGSFNHISYLTNIDVLLAPRAVSKETLKAVKFEQDNRCFSLEAKEAGADLQAFEASLLNLSVIAATEQVANQIRRLKSGDQIRLSGDWVQVFSAKSKHEYHVALTSGKSNHCRLFRVSHIQKLN